MPQMAPLAWWPLMMLLVMSMITFMTLSFWLATGAAPRAPQAGPQKSSPWKW